MATMRSIARLFAARDAKTSLGRLDCDFQTVARGRWVAPPVSARAAAPRLDRVATGATAGLSSTTAETHGGDDVHRVQRLICDFSVTTNALGPVPSALAAVKEIMNDVEVSWTSPRGGDVKAILEDHGERLISAPAVEHYPKRRDLELERAAAEFLRCGEGEAAQAFAEQRLLFGNGASELIDLLARAAPQGPYCVAPNVLTQYREYERACRSAGRANSAKPSDAAILCLVNPTNPTGDFVERLEMEAYIAANAAPGSWVLVDESMLFWAGPQWHSRGVSDAFVQRMLKRHIKVFRIYSWTKIFSCTGLRIGSAVCPSPDSTRLLESLQVPWSVSVFARKYLQVAIKDADYMERTWSTTPRWREHMVTLLRRVYPEWQFHGQDWLSWVWVDTGDAEVARSVYEAALDCGCPVRHAAAGYGLPTYLRFAVRRPSDFAALHQALLKLKGGYQSKQFGTYADVQPSVIEGVQLVHIDDLRPHENVYTEAAAKLQRYIEALPLAHLPAIIVCSETMVLIDGHHRLELFRASGMTIVPAVLVRYGHEDILVNPPHAHSKVSKETVIFNALQGVMLEPKSTQHMVRSRSGHLMPIIALAPLIAELRIAE